MTDPLERVATAIERMADNQERFYREVLDVLSAAKDGDGSLRSEQPAAAPDGQEELTTRLRKLVEDSRPFTSPGEDPGPYGRGWDDGISQVANDLEAILDSTAPSQQEGEDT